eukprot:m.818795 g.818795  ORF g.818795 m.818795 type:complete len:193 (+) comp59388_c0_seq126:3786-4364(+)
MRGCMRRLWSLLRLRSAPSWFQRVTDAALGQISESSSTSTISSFFSRNLAEHLTTLRQVLGRLGHLVSGEGVRPCPEKLRALESLPEPQFAQLARPLFDLLKKDTEFEWATQCQHAKKQLLSALLANGVLQFPDLAKQFVVTTDASTIGIGAVLSQDDCGVLRPVQFLSRALQPAERNSSGRVSLSRLIIQR